MTNPVPITIPCPAEFWPQQSPVDLADAIRAKFPNNYLQFEYPSQVVGEFIADPLPSLHGFNLVLKEGSSASIIVAGKTCSLKKIHFHARSEHRRGNQDYPLEIHLVHEIEDPELGSTKVVLGVFVDHSKAKSTPKSFVAIESMLGSPEVKTTIARLLKREATDTEPPANHEVSINPNHCLPNNRKKFYRYEGSLTSAPFPEILSWIVFRNPIKVLAEDIEEIKKQATHEARPIQPLGRRFVLRSF